MVKIILCTTFRDFKGTENDEIQYRFLDGIRQQTYQNYQVVTTTFGEKKVKNIVDAYLKEKSIVKNIDIDPQYRFSLTDVVLNGIEVAETCFDDCILVWCTCDILLEPNFFQILVNHYKRGFAGIVHPNIIYKSLDDLENDKGKFGPVDMGIDLLFFDGAIFKTEGKNDIEKYRFYEWGVFELFLAAVSKMYASQLINLFCISKVRKIVNNRKLTNESKEYFNRCLKMNNPIQKRYCIDKGLDPNIWCELFKIHKQYEMLDTGYVYFLLRIKGELYFCGLMFLSGVKKILKCIGIKSLLKRLGIYNNK